MSKSKQPTSSRELIRQVDEQVRQANNRAQAISIANAAERKERARDNNRNQRGRYI